MLCIRFFPFLIDPRENKTETKNREGLCQKAFSIFCFGFRVREWRGAAVTGLPVLFGLRRSKRGFHVGGPADHP